MVLKARVDRRQISLLLMLSLVAGARGQPATLTLRLSSDQALDAAMVELWKNGGARPVAELVDVPFDELLVFPETTPSGRINDAAGTRLLKGKYYLSSTQLFLFRQGGRGVRAVMVSPDVFQHEVQNARFGPRVRVVAPGGKRLMTLKD